MINTLTTKVNQDSQLARIELVTNEVTLTAKQEVPLTCLANVAKALGVAAAGGAAGYELGHAIH
jgi:hypothetical protein